MKTKKDHDTMFSVIGMLVEEENLVRSAKMVEHLLAGDQKKSKKDWEDEEGSIRKRKKIKDEKKSEKTVIDGLNRQYY